jgi:hypothetical protein
MTLQELMYQEAVEVCVTRLSETIANAAAEGYTAFLYDQSNSVSLRDIAAGIRRVFPDCRTYIQGSQMVIDWTLPGTPVKLAALRKTNS